MVVNRMCFPRKTDNMQHRSASQRMTFIGKLVLQIDTTLKKPIKTLCRNGFHEANRTFHGDR